MRMVKQCAECGGGFDAFRAMEVRGRFCSPECLQASRRRRAEPVPLDEVPQRAEGLPAFIMLGSPDMIVRLAAEGA